MAGLSQNFSPANLRPLYDYMRPSEVYRCPADKGSRILPCTDPRLKPSKWLTIGCSYQYNAGALTVMAGGGFRQVPADAREGLASKPESWVPTPERYILMHEPPARLYGCPQTPPEWYQWHYSRARSDIDDPRTAPAQFISPVAFVDGHAATHNFSKSLTVDPLFPYEPTKDWIWYKPALIARAYPGGSMSVSKSRVPSIAAPASASASEAGETDCCGGAK